MSDTLHRVKVTINHQDYYLKGQEDPPEMQKIASLVDEKIQAISAATQCGALQAAVLCALQLASELDALKADYDALLAELDALV